MQPSTVSPASILSEPSAYPFDIRQTGFVVDNGRVEQSIPVMDAADIPPIDRLGTLCSPAGARPVFADPIVFLTSGSNASLRRLREKLETCPVRSAYALRVRMKSWVPVYAATLSFYGSIPATFAHRSGAVAEPFLIVTDAANFDAMARSEQRTGNYDVYSVPNATTGLTLAAPVFAFICRFGALHLDGEPMPLREFQPGGSGGISQVELLKRVLSQVAPELDLDTFKARSNDTALLADLRARIVATYTTPLEVPGWSQVPT